MNIDLASFNINTDQLFQKLVQTRTEIDRVKASQVQLRAEFTTSNKDVASNQKSLDDLNKKLSELTKGTDSYNQTLLQRDNAEKVLNESSKQQIAVNQSYQATLTASQLELNKLNNQARSYQSVLDAQNRSTNDSITLYERQRAELSLLQKEQRDIGARLLEMKNNGQQNTEQFKTLSLAYEEASKKANGLSTELRKVDVDGGNFTSTIGTYKESITAALNESGLFSGKIGGLISTFKGFGSEVTEAKNKLLAINDAVVLNGKNTLDYIQSLFAKTVATEANTLANEQNIVSEVAATIAEESHVVANATVASSSLLASAGIEAQSAANVGLIATTEGAVVAEGSAVVSTNLLNASLAILLSPITLIIAALGILIYIFKDFAPIINPVKDAFAGLLAIFSTIKSAIFDVVTGARSLGDVFSSMGGEMSDAAKEAYNLAKELRGIAKAQDIQEVTNARTKTLVDKLMLQARDLTKTAKERAQLLTQAQDLEKKNFDEIAKLNARAIEAAEKKLFEGKKISKEERKYLDENNYAKIRDLKVTKNLDDEAIQNYKKLLIEKESLQQQDTAILEKAQNRKNKILEKDLEKQNKANEDAKKAREKSIEDAKKAREKAKKDRQDALKAELDSAQKLADEKVKLANVELNAYIEKNKSILDNEKFLTPELVKQEQERLRNIEKAKLDQEKLEFDTADKIFKDKIKAFGDESKLNQTQLNELATLKLKQKELELNYNSDVTKIKEETQKGITATETRYSNERIEAEKMRKAVQFQTELLDLEARGATEQEIKQAQLDQETQLELDKFIEKQDTKFQTKIKKDQEERDIQAEIDLVQQELEAELLAAKDENEKIRIQTQLDALANLEKTSSQKKVEITKAETQARLASYGNLFGNIAELLGKDTQAGKAAAIAQIGISQGLAIARIWEQKSTLPSPFGVIAKVAETGIAVGNVIQALGKVNSVQTPKAQRGMITKGKSHANGGIPAVVAGNTTIELEGGEAIINKKSTAKFGSVLSQINQAGGGVRFATGGVVGSPIASLSNIQNQFTNQLNSEALTESIRTAVLEGSAIGTATGSQRGISDLTENNYISSTANF